MRLFLFRLSLTERPQADLLADSRLNSREEFLKHWFSEPTNFEVSEQKQIRFWKIQIDQDIIAGSFNRYHSETVESDEDDPHRSSQGNRWEHSSFFVNIGNDEQVIAIERNGNVGQPQTLVKKFVDHINSQNPSNKYNIEVFSLNSQSDFWDAIRRHENQDKKITKITFELVVPNPGINSTASVEAGLKELARHSNAENVSEIISNRQGLKLDSDYIKAHQKYVSKGGGDLVAKDGQKTVYSSKTRQRTIEVSDDLRADGSEKMGLAQKLKGLLTR